MTARVFTVEPASRRIRLDVFLAAAMAPEYSRSRIARMIRAGAVSVNDARTGDPAHALRPGDRIGVAPLPLAEPSERRNEPAFVPPVAVLYADEEVIVIDKPAGMVVHPAPGSPGPTLVDALLRQFPDLAAMAEPGAVMRPGIVHRLDKETSGVMVIARTPYARMELSRQFKDRTVRKLYLAVVRGIVGREAQVVARPLGRHPTERQRMSTRSRRPREASTSIAVLHRFDERGEGNPASTLVRAIPATGRTHQIRVHLASIGHPCLGDRLYGRAAAGEAGPFVRHALHALGLEFAHPRSGLRMRYSAPIPPDFRAFLEPRGIQLDPEAVAGWLTERSAANPG